jgi:DNA-directed RNA polymerase subunit N (RpoN/RPB10)
VNCFVCGKKKEDYEVWTNKIVIGVKYDSIFQDHDIIRNLSNKSIICHQCIKSIEDEVVQHRK